jgi:hypothetical protein
MAATGEIQWPPVGRIPWPPSAEALSRGREWSDRTWKGDFGAQPSEAEIICHVTVPLLLALGWPREQIAIGWHYRDIALFSEMRRAPETCRFVIEAKTLGEGLGFARKQVDRYAREYGHAVMSSLPTARGCGSIATTRLRRRCT